MHAVITTAGRTEPRRTTLPLRRLWWSAFGVGLLALLTACAGPGSAGAGTSVPPPIAAPASPLPSVQAPEAQPTKQQALPLGSPLTSTSFEVTFHTVEVAAELATVTGAPLRAEPGTQLVLIRGTYTVLGPDGVDLSCAKYDIFVQARDSEGGEMANLFAEPDLAGNPKCNTKLLTGQSSDWVFAYKMVEGRQPGWLSVVDKNFYGANQWSEPVQMLLG